MPDTESPFSAALRIFHPSLQPEEISNALGVSPQHAWAAGEPRHTPRGDPLEGHYAESYWTHRRRAEEDASVSGFLGTWLRELQGAAEFLRRIRAEGGRVEFYLTWSRQRFQGDVIDHTVMRALSELGIDLGVEVFD